MTKGFYNFSKYNSKKTVVDGITFSSKKEAKRYEELKLLLQSGDILNIELQPKFPIIINGVKVCTYIADFKYFDNKLKDFIVEDVKGFKTPVYNLKKKLLLATYGGINFREI